MFNNIDYFLFLHKNIAMVNFDLIFDLYNGGSTPVIKVTWYNGDGQDYQIVNPIGTILATVTATIGTGTTTITTFNSEPITGYPISGNYYITNTKFGVNIVLPFSTIFPTISLSMEHSCLLSTLTVSDVTSYKYSVGGSSYSADSTSSCIQTIKWPVTMPTAHADTVSASSNLGIIQSIGANIWTGIYNASIVSLVDYTIPFSGSNNVIIHVSLVGQNTHLATCTSQCVCLLKQCIFVMEQEWYLCTNERRTDELRRNLDRLNDLLNLLNIAEKCADSALSSWACNEVSLIVTQASCTCDVPTTTTGVSTEIIPVVSGGSGTTIYYNNILLGAYPTGTAPAAGVGSDGDIAINTDGTDGAMYRKIAGSWVFQTDLMPTPPSAVTSYEMLFHDLTAVGTDAAVAEKKIGTATIGVGDWGGLSSDLRFTIGILLGINASNKAIRVEMTDTDTTVNLIDYLIDWEITAANKYIDIIFDLNVIATNSELGVLMMTGSNQPIKTSYVFKQTNALTINVYGENYVATANDVVQQQLKIENFKK